jgi:hypothetical protein
MLRDWKNKGEIKLGNRGIGKKEEENKIGSGQCQHGYHCYRP